MRTAGLFDKTVQKTHAWIAAVMDELGWEDAHKAYQALRLVLHTLRDRLTVEEAVQFAAQLPMLVRGFYYEGWAPTGNPLKHRHKQEFLSNIFYHFMDKPDIDPEQVAR